MIKNPTTFEEMKNQVICSDCLDIMKLIPDNSIDMILCDLPYGTTACKWDTIIPFEPLWEVYKRIIKDNGAIVLTASQPFTSKLVMSNLKMFKYEWVWEKTQPSNSLLANKQPLKYTENIIVFYLKQPTYNPQKWKGEINHGRNDSGEDMKSEIIGSEIKRTKTNKSGIKYPKNIIKIPAIRQDKLHPTQKPVALFEYLIKTYTSAGDVVLDNCAGSFTTSIASENLKRNWICIEKEEKYCEIGIKRIKENRDRLR